jgi:hypothetical protein
MGSLSNYAENELLDHLLKVGAFSVPSNIYVALSTADPLDDGSGLAEPSGGSYARVACNSWNAASGRAATNAAVVQFARATVNWGALTHFALFDASTGGNMLAHGSLFAPDGTTPLTLTVTTDMRPRIPAAALSVSWNSGGLSNYAAHKLLDHLLKTASFTVPSNIYVAFSTANPTDSGGSIAEPSGNNYSRTVLNGWDAASGGASSNSADFEGPVASGSWGTITHFALFDASSSGNMLGYGALNASRSITVAIFPEFLAGELDVTMN